MKRALAALDRLSREAPEADGWISTGAIADAVGWTAGDTAAALRGASDRGLCTCRRSLVEGTAWRLTPTGELVASRDQQQRSVLR